MWSDKITQYLLKQRSSNGYRKRIANTGGNSRFITVEKKSYLNFASNDYLGMSHHPEIIQAWQNGAQQFGLGSGGSGHITGYSLVHQEFEQQLANWLGYSRSILFTSGFSANQALIYSLTDDNHAIIADKLAHASIQEAAHLSSHHFYRFLHNDTLSLRKICQKIESKFFPLIVSEGVFSMDGDIAPLPELRKITDQHQGLLMIDDAHGIGVRGEAGKGCCHEQNIRADILIVTFGKAFGINGSAILCDDLMADYLIQKARHLIYSTNMPIAQAYALQTALKIIQLAETEREKLRNNIALFRQLAKQASLRISDSTTAIQPFIVGDNQLALTFAERLKQKRIWLTAIRPPTVPVGAARLRITLSAFHEADDIAYLVESLSHCLNGRHSGRYNE